MVGVVGDRGEVFKNFANPLFDEGVVAVLLNLDESGDIDDFIDRTELASFGFAILVNR